MTFEESVFAQLIASLFAPKGNGMLGKFKIDIIYLVINYKVMIIPLLWTLLPKKGCSNMKERIELLEKFRKTRKGTPSAPS